MGHLIKGKWNNDDVATSNVNGEFDREKSNFLETISHDHNKYKPESGRYHLYVSYACPWAHRTLIARKLKKLEEHISVSVVHPDMLENSWTFSNSFEGTTGDTLYELNYLHQLYKKHDQKVTTKVTVPVLWDKKTETIVNNESSEIIRIFNRSFDRLISSSIDLYPKELKSEIDAMNTKVYEPINNGVYKTGFAKNQKAYEKSFDELFNTLEWLDQYLENKKFLVSDDITEADIRLVTTLLRFDIVYYTHFKCNLKKISEYLHLSRYTKDLYNNYDEIKSTTHFNHIKRHYYFSHDFINPHRIVPKGPEKYLL